MEGRFLHRENVVLDLLPIHQNSMAAFEKIVSSALTSERVVRLISDYPFLFYIGFKWAGVTIGASGALYLVGYLVAETD